LVGSTGDLVTIHPLDPDDASIIGGIKAAAQALAATGLFLTERLQGLTTHYTGSNRS
jgi:hypothetical protein